MASLARTHVVAEASTKFRVDWHSSGASDVKVTNVRHPYSNNRDTWAGHGCFDRAAVCCSDKLVNLGVRKAGLLPCKVYKISRGKKSFRSVTQCEYGSKPATSDSMGGDPKVQQVLVEMVKLQVGKARMAELVDERSQHLRNIAEEAHLEYDRIAFRAMKGLDATGSRVLQQLDSDAGAIERDLRSARAELEAQSRDFEEFQVRNAYLRNEGLFFKNLYQAPSSSSYRSTLSKNPIEEKVVVLTPASSSDFSSSYRQLLYGGLSLVIVSFIWSSTSAFVAGTCMRASKLASYGIIISLLLTQLAYAKVITGEADSSEESEDLSE